jgi:uncharacterized protein
MIPRSLAPIIEKKLHTGKIILLSGPRQVGKTTLIKSLLSNKDYLFLDGDDPTVKLLLADANTEQLKALVGKKEYVFIDEAQRIPNIGLSLKIMHDQLKGLKILVSGSSSFDLQNQLNEPLTGRKWEFQLFPVSWPELEAHLGLLPALQQLPVRLIYGSYPEIINHAGEERDYLNELVNSFLFKDILSYTGIRKPEVLEKLLRALAFQLGSEVSYNELAQLTGVDKNTVSSYLTLLEQAYVIFPLPSFSRNLRNEIKSNRKIYFYDNGVRNSLIQNFNPLELRQDTGALWENFLVAERMKFHAYKKSYTQCYFWRTLQQQEIDFIEESQGVIKAYEFKWNPQKKHKSLTSFTETYNAPVEVIHPKNFRDFLHS